MTRLLADGVRLFAAAIPIAIILRLGQVKVSDLNVHFISILMISGVTFIYTLLGGIKASLFLRKN